MEITQEQQKMAGEAVRKHGVLFAVIFGSQTNGKARENSNLDIGILDPKPETYKRYGDPYNDFCKIFKGQNVDLRIIQKTETNPVLLYDTFMKGEFLTGDEQEFFQYRAYAYKNFIDSKPLLELKKK
ncbi:MAG: nucleotidyltransferase domain-containing protein [Candidatus Pacebacteria bacterium]|nr:nucleotidyltransferase domain-containing protein [Candidatus Paceibacterota bacterium]